MTATIPHRVPKHIEALTISWPLLPDDHVLPDDPVENAVQPLLANILTLSIATLPRERVAGALAVTDFALCAGINGRIICKAPDWMYFTPTNQVKGIRRSYTPHKEGPVPPVVMEFLSASDCGEYSMNIGDLDSNRNHKVGKWHFYERVVEVPTYVIFEPESARLEVYALKDNRYEIEPANEEDRYFIPGLDLYLGVWHGEYALHTGWWLRWWDKAGQIVPLPQEQAQEAESKAQEAESKAQKAESKVQEALAEAERERNEKEVLLSRLRAAGLE